MGAAHLGYLRPQTALILFYINGTRLSMPVSSEVQKKSRNGAAIISYPIPAAISQAVSSSELSFRMSDISSYGTQSVNEKQESILNLKSCGRRPPSPSYDHTKNQSGVGAINDPVAVNVTQKQRPVSPGNQAHIHLQQHNGIFGCDYPVIVNITQ